MEGFSREERRRPCHWNRRDRCASGPPCRRALLVAGTGLRITGTGTRVYALAAVHVGGGHRSEKSRFMSSVLCAFSNYIEKNSETFMNIYAWFESFETFCNNNVFASPLEPAWADTWCERYLGYTIVSVSVLGMYIGGTVDAVHNFVNADVRNRVRTSPDLKLR